MSDLEALLGEARKADPGDRIVLRDPIAEHGELAIEAMTDWLGDPRLAAFAIRVLVRIGLDSIQRQAVVDVLVAVDRRELAGHLAGDLDDAVSTLGVGGHQSTRHNSTGGPVAGDRPMGTPGLPGRGYWAMRTSPWERPYIWAQAREGRLRQGWGWAAEQNLEVIADVVHAGRELSEEQELAWPSRRMLSTEGDGMQAGDLILAPNIPEWGQLCVFRLVGSYEYSPDEPRRFDDRFGHILPVELVSGPIDRSDTLVSDALRSTLRSPGRLWSLRPYGGDVERLAGALGSKSRPTAVAVGIETSPERTPVTGELERRADALLAAIGSNAEAIGDAALTMHWPTVGAAFDHGVLVVGQAVYGWMNSWTAQEVREANVRERVIGEAKNPFPDLKDPMAWIDGHHARTSPFWTVAHQVTDALSPGRAPWFSRLAWANLCPVAPNDIKGNPSGALLRAQTSSAAPFLERAIEEIQPRLVVVVGGPYIWPYVEPLNLEVLQQAAKPLYLAGRRNDVDWIVGMHPGGASRRGWSPMTYAELIVATVQSKAIGSLGTSPEASSNVDQSRHGGGRVSE